MCTLKVQLTRCNDLLCTSVILLQGNRVRVEAMVAEARLRRKTQPSPNGIASGTAPAVLHLHLQTTVLLSQSLAHSVKYTVQCSPNYARAEEEARRLCG